MKGKLLIPILVFFLSICSNAFAYVEQYPPYNFKDGPPDHLEAELLVNNDNSEYKSEDGKVSVRLNKTEIGVELVITESNYIIVNKDVVGLPLPYAVYMVDLDGNSHQDFIVFYRYGDLKKGIKEERVEIFLKREEAYFQKISYDSLTAGLGDFVDMDKDGSYEVIISGMYQGTRRKYFDYNIYDIIDYRLLNADGKFKDFPKFIRYTFKANDENAKSLTEEERSLITSEKNSSILYHKLQSKKNLSLVDKSEKSDDRPIIVEDRDEISKNSVKSNVPENVVEVNDQELDDPLVIRDKLLQAAATLKEKDLQLEASLAAKDRELKEALEAKDKELLNMLALKDNLLKVLQEKELFLKSELKAKEMEFEKALTAKEKELEEVEAALKLLKERELGLMARLESSDVAVEKDQESSELRSDENISFKIGVVNVQRVIEESKKGMEARKYFEGLFSLRSEEELAKTQDELLEQIVRDIEYIIREYAEKEKITYVTEKLEGGVIFSEERFDITDEIIRLYNQKVETLKP